MPDEEQLVAEQTVTIDIAQALTVRITQHPAEEFYRVDVASSTAPEWRASTTVAGADNFMIDLIHGALSGEQVAWQHLAHWGQGNLAGPNRLPRRCFS